MFEAVKSTCKLNEQNKSIGDAVSPDLRCKSQYTHFVLHSLCISQNLYLQISCNISS